MRHAIRSGLEIVTVAAFAVSALAKALRGDVSATSVASAGTGMLTPSGFIGRPVLSDPAPEMFGIIQQPVNGALWLLLVTVVAAAAFYLVVRWRGRFAEPLPAATMLGLAAATIWPWVSPGAPGAGLALAALAPLGVIGGILQDRDMGLTDRGDAALGVIAGWLLIGGMGAAAALMHLELGVRVELAALAGLLAASLIGGRVQLSLGSNVGFAGAIIWAMLGIAAASLSVSMTIATACVLGIAAMVVVLVRVTT